MNNTILDPEALEPEDVEADERAIAIVGLSGAFPGADDLDGLWDLVAAGKTVVRELTDEELLDAGVPRGVFERPDYVRAASHLEGGDLFDADFFGYTPNEAEIMDPQQRLFLEHAWATLEDSGIRPDRHEGLIGVYAGVAWNTYLLSNLMAHRELFDGAGGFQVFITNDKDFMPTRVSYKLDLKGPAMIVQTSCSTSLVATHLACLGLLNYECDVALAGGVTLRVPGKSGYFHQEGGLASPDGYCRTFDERGAGTIFGSGIGLVALKRLSDALEDGDRIRAVIRGSAINNDGSVKVSYTAPSVEGQAEVVAAAQEMADVDIESIRYIECHGTATTLGDPIEVRALTKVYREATDKQNFCALGSIKSNVGHLDAAAGIAGLIKTIFALERRTIPPIAHFERPNPALDLDSSPFYIAPKAEAWTTEPGVPRRAGVSSFGVGGTNAHLIVEEAPEPAATSPSRRWQLLTLSAKNKAALDDATANLARFLESSDADPADVAHTLRTGRTVFRHRRTVLGRDRGELLAALTGERKELAYSAADSEDPRERPVAFLFSGQGSQYVDMGRELYDDEPVFRTVIDEAADVLQPTLGEDLRQLMWPAAEADREAATAKLNRTRVAQPALLALELALAKLWQSWGITPAAMIGHSIGEFAAACVAGVMDRPDALRLVAKRGQLMDALPPGAMLALPISEAVWRNELASRHPELSLAAINEPERIVVSGPFEAIDRLMEERTETAGELAAGRRLHTSHAFHSAMMDPILDTFTAEVRRVKLSPPEIPFISNVSGTWITEDKATDPAYWASHLRSAVRFADGVACLVEEEARLFLEVGPGRALATLAGRHPARQTQQAVLTSLRHPADASTDSGEDQASMLTSLGRLWLDGIDFGDALDQGETRRRLSLPTYPFQRRRYWIEAGETPTAAPAQSLGKRPDMAEWFYLPGWRVSLAPTFQVDDLPEHCLVLSLPNGPGRALAKRLESLGKSATLVEPSASGSGLAHEDGFWRLDPTSPKAFGELFAALDEGIGPPNAILHAWAYDGTACAVEEDRAPVKEDRAPAEDLDSAQPLAFGSLLALTQALAASSASDLDLLVLADSLIQVVDGEPLQPVKAPLLGLVRVIPDELPNVRCHAVDASWSLPGSTAEARLVGHLLDELARSEDDPKNPKRSDNGAELIALRGRQRWVEAYEPQPLEALDEDATPWTANGAYALTGGLQGNGYALARALARSIKPRLTLLEDTPVDGDAHRLERIAALEELGAQVTVEVVEWTDIASWTRALDRAEERFGALQAVLHAAGTDGESTFRPLASIDQEHLDWHFGPKIRGTLALAASLNQKPRPELGFCLLLSSLASVLGGLAYGAYAAANHFLDAFARQHSNDDGPRFVSVGWDVWEFEHEATQVTQLRADLAELAMKPREGEDAMDRALAAGLPSILVSTGDLETRRAARRARMESHRGAAASAGKTPNARHPRPDLQTPFAAPTSELEHKIAGVWREVLGFEEVGLDDNFFELGGDSFIAVQATARLKEALDIDIPVAQLFQRLTVRALAEFVADSAQASAKLAEQLAERRQSMNRRRDALEKRRARRQLVRG